jgi:hypothetical protein
MDTSNVININNSPNRLQTRQTISPIGPNHTGFNFQNSDTPKTLSDHSDCLEFISKLSNATALSFTKITFSVRNIQDTIHSLETLQKNNNPTFNNIPPHLIKNIQLKHFIENPKPCIAYLKEALKTEITKLHEKSSKLLTARQKIYDDAKNSLTTYQNFINKYSNESCCLSLFDQKFDFFKIKIENEFNTKNQQHQTTKAKKKEHFIAKLQTDNELVHISKAEWNKLQLQLKTLSIKQDFHQRGKQSNTTSSPQTPQKSKKEPKGKGKLKN